MASRARNGSPPQVEVREMETVKVSSVTPYRAAQIVNTMLAEANIKKVLPPQMFYSYTTSRLRNGQEPLIACDERGRITVEALVEWTKKYMAKQQSTSEA